MCCMPAACLLCVLVVLPSSLHAKITLLVSSSGSARGQGEEAIRLCPIPGQGANYLLGQRRLIPVRVGIKQNPAHLNCCTMSQEDWANPAWF